MLNVTIIMILKDALFQIPGGNTQANAAALNINALAAITHVTKFCGRFLNLQTGIALSATVCSKLFSDFKHNLKLDILFNPNNIGGF